MRPKLVMGWFLLRSSRQRRDIHRAAVVLALSEAFGRHLVEDYGVEPTRISIAPNPIDLERFRPPRDALPTPGPLTVAIVGRLSVRKGLELVVELSHRLQDLSGSVHLEIVGNPSQWSNYRPLLDDIDPTVASFDGSLSHDDLEQWLPTCDLLIQPAKYEPFGLTVGEAMACGVPVVVTTEVGAGEGVSEVCCTWVPPGDIAALEAAVRGMVARLCSSDSGPMRDVARSEAERLWSAVSVTRPVQAALLQAAGFETLIATPSGRRRGNDSVPHQLNGARDKTTATGTSDA
ncbi:MAG: glycosyltransferase family 4 protein [Acidimicrobiales bacterium]